MKEHAQGAKPQWPWHEGPNRFNATSQKLETNRSPNIPNKETQIRQSAYLRPAHQNVQAQLNKAVDSHRRMEVAAFDDPGT